MIDPAFVPIRFSYGAVCLEVLAGADLEGQLADDLDADRIPYWSVLWDSALGLSRWLVERGAWSGVSVLELGCGVGLAGLVAAAMGARVTQTDLFFEAVVTARENARRNRLSGMEQLMADWRAWSLPGQWPVVLGSDVTYDRSLHGALLAVLDRTVGPGGAVYLADPGRPMSVDFLALAEASRWRVHIANAPTPPGERETFVYTLTRDEA